jgi:hypothetical protein
MRLASNGLNAIALSEEERDEARYSLNQANRDPSPEVNEGWSAQPRSLRARLLVDNLYVNRKEVS